MPTSNKRRPSYINLTNVNNVNITAAGDILSPRTPRSISKSRRSSVVAEHVQDVIYESTSSTTTSGSGSRRGSLVLNGPSLLSDSTNSYYQDLAAKDTTRSETSTLKARKMSNEDLLVTSRRTRSSSISSLLGGTLPSYDVHALYKIKTTRSSKKLDSFFGEYAPHDICVKEIRKEGLKAILESKTPLCYFLYHLLEEYSSENLFFFIELEQFESFNYTSIQQQLATAQHIFNTYLTRNSYFEVNLDDRVRRKVTEALEQKNAKSCFNNAKRAVFLLLESSYMRFQSTDTFENMVKNCGELTTFYDEKARTAAVNQLVKYIQKEETKISSTKSDNTFQNTTMRRHELIKSMIHEFCRTFVGVEFTRQPQNNNPSSPGTKFRHINFPPFGKEPITK